MQEEDTSSSANSLNALKVTAKAKKSAEGSTETREIKPKKINDLQRKVRHRLLSDIITNKKKQLAESSASYSNSRKDFHNFLKSVVVSSVKKESDEEDFSKHYNEVEEGYWDSGKLQVTFKLLIYYI